MKKNRSISPSIFITLSFVTATIVVADPQTAFAQSASTGATANAQLPPAPAPPAMQSAPNGALPPPPPAPGSPQPMADQPGPPTTGYPYAGAPYPPPPMNYAEYNRMYPKELAYEDGAEVPYGYRKVEKRRVALIAAGASTFGGLYTITLFGALLSGEPKYAIPVVGPFLGIETRSSNSLSGFFDSLANIFFIIDGLGQAGGVAMLIAGIPSKTILVRNDVVAFKPQFSVGPGSVSMQMKF